MGAKKNPFYRIVVIDSREARNGVPTETLGWYDPTKLDAPVQIDGEKAVYWLSKGAQPTDTVRNILKNEGVYLMKHLRGGVKKGAFDEAEAQKKFDAWKENKQKGFDDIREKDAKAKKDAEKAELEAEKKMNESIAKKVAEKKAAETAAKAEAEAEKTAEEAAPEAEEAAPEAEEAAPAEA